MGEQPRTPGGVPEGGRWSDRRRGEASIALGAGTGPWPGIAWEERPWEAEPQPGESRRARLAARGPYEAALVPEIAELNPVAGISQAALAECEAATVEMVRFDAEMGLGAAPFASVLLRSESSSSSEIEHLTVGARRLALAELGDRSSPNAVLVAHNVSALRSAIALSEDLSVEAVEKMHWSLLGEAEPDRAGRLRAQQVWIGGRSPHTAEFVPPHHERVPAAMEDLVGFMRRDDVPALVQAAVAHAQFETIHPFTDGNGRTGRAIVSALLRSKGITPNVAVPVSSGLLRDTRGYFRDLEAYRDGDVEPIVARFSEAAFHAVGTGRELVQDLKAAEAEHAEALAGAPRSARDAAALLVRSPAVTAELLQRELGMTQPTAYRTLERLQAVEVIRPAGHIAGARVWIAPAVVDALDAFADRAGRRSRGH